MADHIEAPAEKPAAPKETESKPNNLTTFVQELNSFIPPASTTEKPLAVREDGTLDFRFDALIPEEFRQTEVEEQQARLQEAAQEHFTPEEYAKFLADMAAFEERARAQGLSEREIANTYGEIARLLEADNAAVPAEERANIAFQLMDHAAHPENINQGGHGTCTVTALENRMFTRNPDDAIKLVVDVAITGKYTAADGKEIVIDPDSLVPDVEARDRETADGARSHASQIFNIVTINDITQREDPPRFYREIVDDPNSVSSGKLYDEDGKFLEPFSGLNAEQYAAEGERLMGDENFVIVHDDHSNADGTVRIDSVDELEDALLQLKVDGQLPAVVRVFMPGGHVIVIRDYDPETGMVTFDNQWGSANDRVISINELYQLMDREEQKREEPRKEKPKGKQKDDPNWWDPRHWF